MAMLHTVNKSPFERNSLKASIDRACDGAGMLLIEDAVYGAVDGTACADTVREAMKHLDIYALGPDLKARGIDESRLIDGIRIVDYSGFVDLTIEYSKYQSWL